MLHSICQHICETQQGHRIGWGQFSSQSQRRIMPKNVQTTIQLHSYLHASKVMAISFKLGFNSLWTKNSWCSSWIWKRQKNQRSNCQHLLDHRESKRIFKKSTSASLITLKPLTVWITTNWKILQEMEIPDHLTCLLRNLHTNFSRGRSGGLVCPSLSEFSSLLWSTQSKALA